MKKESKSTAGTRRLRLSKTYKSSVTNERKLKKYITKKNEKPD